MQCFKLLGVLFNFLGLSSETDWAQIMAMKPEFPHLQKKT